MSDGPEETIHVLIPSENSRSFKNNTSEYVREDSRRYDVRTVILM